MQTTGERRALLAPTGRRRLAPLVLLLVAAACGGGDGEQSAGRDPVPPSAPAPVPEERAGSARPDERTDGEQPSDSLTRPSTRIASVEPGPFVSRPDIPAVPVDIRVSKPTAPGLLFLTPARRQQRGPVIIDNEGDIVFSRPHHLAVTDLQVQRYQSEPVLTWWEGDSFDGRGDGEYVIVDSSYREVARFTPGNELPGDMHDFELTEKGTALILGYDPEPADLTPFGGPADGFIYEYYVQEVDVGTGEVLLEWRMSDHVSPSETFSTLPGTDGAGSAKSPFDWAHVNSVAEDGDDTLLVSARNTNAVYAVDRRSGELRWRLGGTQSDFVLGEGAAFSLQHDARRQPDGTISIFDNVEPTRNESRALFLDVDETTRTATLVRELRHDERIRANTRGNAQLLPTGGVVIGWGSERRISEFSPDDELVFDASIAPTVSYRTYRFEWEGRPADPPDVAVRISGFGALDVHMSWNGATEVSQWRILGGDDPDDLQPLATVAKDGFETQAEVAAVDYVAVEALVQSGEVLGTSEIQRPA